MEARATQQGGFVVDVPASAAPPAPEPAMDVFATGQAAHGQQLRGPLASVATQGETEMAGGSMPASYGGIPIDLDPQAAAAPQQQLSAIPGGDTTAAEPQHAVARALVDSLAAMVERKVAADEEAMVDRKVAADEEAMVDRKVAADEGAARERKDAVGAGAQQENVAHERPQLREQGARGTERRLIHELEHQMHTIRKDLKVIGEEGGGEFNQRS
jgi:hypothetical protein